MRGKKVKGRKRHALVDTLGLPEVLQVTGAQVQDRDGGRAVLEVAQLQCPRFHHGWMDGAYQALVEWAAEAYGWTLEVVKRPPDQQGFAVLPRRWVVERLFGWFSHYRRLSKDYEVWPETHVSMLHLALIHLLVRRQAI
jgi:putative transposase